MNEEKDVNGKKGDVCQFCRETLKKDAFVCSYCGREKLTDEEIKQLKISNLFIVSIPIGIFGSLIFFSNSITIGWIFLLIFTVAYIIGRHFTLKENTPLVKLQKKKREYKFQFLYVGFALLLGLLMFITNPQKKDIYEHIRYEHSKLKSIEIIEEKTWNCIFFSFYSVDIGFPIIGKESHYYFGILNRIYELDAKKVEESFKSEE